MQRLAHRITMKARSLRERLESAYRALRDPAEPEVAVQTSVVEPEAPPRAKPVNWELRSQAELVEYIVSHHHAGLRRDLPLVIDAARRVERDHKDDPAAPRGLADLIEALANELDAHMEKEERILFPLLRLGQRGGSIDMPIRMMERDHESHEAAVAEIRRVTHDLRAPEHAPAAWTKLYEDLAVLESSLREHVYLEDRVLFARALGGEY